MAGEEGAEGVPGGGLIEEGELAPDWAGVFIATFEGGADVGTWIDFPAMMRSLVIPLAAMIRR